MLPKIKIIIAPKNKNNHIYYIMYSSWQTVYVNYHHSTNLLILILLRHPFPPSQWLVCAAVTNVLQAMQPFWVNDYKGGETMLKISSKLSEYLSIYNPAISTVCGRFRQWGRDTWQSLLEGSQNLSLQKLFYKCRY